MDKNWFEMAEIRHRTLANASWIPLRAAKHPIRLGKWGFVGYQDEFSACGTLAVPLEMRTAAESLGWMDIGLIREHRSAVQDGRYIPADQYEGDGFTGVGLVLAQPATALEKSEWHLHPDFVFALGLRREGNNWLAVDEGYIPVVRLHLSVDGQPELMEVRAEHLRDYLCARKMALRVSTYRSREAVLESLDNIPWEGNPDSLSLGGLRWRGSARAIHEGGHPLGARTAVFHVSRTDVDQDEDVPTMGPPSDTGVVSKSWTVDHQGRKLYHVIGEFWRDEWVEPATASPRIADDPVQPTVFFTTDAAGTRESALTLADGGRWLWFSPEVGMTLAHRRGGGVEWYSKETGSIWCSPGSLVHFGLNAVGLLTVYAKDIALLPEWQQKIWAGFNVAPDGGGSRELLIAQVNGVPAGTTAPERRLASLLDQLNEITNSKFGWTLFRDHEQVPELLVRTHRLRAIDKPGFFALAKDLARLTAERIDTAALQTVVSPPKGEKWQSLKSLENVLGSRMGAPAARTLMGPLFGMNDLRHADAHLPTSDLNPMLALVGVNPSDPWVWQGFQILDSVVSTLSEIAKQFEQFPSASTPIS